MKTTMQMMGKAQKENLGQTRFLDEKLKDQRSRLICEEKKKKNLLLKRLNMIKQNIRKEQEKASSQARLISKFNEQKIKVKAQNKTQKMYYQLFNRRPSQTPQKGQRRLLLRSQNLTKYISRFIEKSVSQKRLKAVDAGKASKLKRGSCKNTRQNEPKSGKFEAMGPMPELVSFPGSMMESTLPSKKETQRFVDSHVNSRKLIPFSMTFDSKSRGSLGFLDFLKSLPNVSHFFLSRIQERETPVNVVDRGARKLYDLRKVHQILNQLDVVKTNFRGDLCGLYDDHLNLIK